MKTRNMARLIGLTPIWLGMIGLVFYTSHDAAWGGGVWERQLMDYFNLTGEIAHLLVFVTRKAVHFTYYGLLAVLSQTYLKLWGVKRPWVAAGLGVALALMVALADEYRQTLTSFRSGKLGDVTLDLAGALCFTALAGWLRRKCKSSRDS